MNRDPFEEMSDHTFEGWAILELMGHRKLAGDVRQVVIAGVAFLRIDVPAADGTVTQFYSAAAVYAITPVTEETARRFGAALVAAPVTRWELPAPAGASEARCVCGHGEDEHLAGNGSCRWLACGCVEFRSGEPALAPDAQTAPEDEV